MDLIDLIDQKAFLGHEFLMWIWYEGEQRDSLFHVGDDDVEVSFDDQLVLEANLAEAEQSRLKGGAPAYSPEARKALQFGKRVSKAKMRVAKGEREWIFTIDADSFLMTGIKIPAVLSEAEDDKFYERMYLIEELDQVWFGLYRQFLELRLGDDWSAEREKIKGWIEEPTAGD